MVEHQGLAHKGGGDFQFRFRVIKSFKTSLDRQIAEAIRIHKRGGGVLNRKGEFNRCSITRLVLDSEAEKEKWNKAWENIVSEVGDEENSIAETRKCKANLQIPRPNKRRKIESEEEGFCVGGTFV